MTKPIIVEQCDTLRELADCCLYNAADALNWALAEEKYNINPWRVPIRVDIAHQWELLAGRLNRGELDFNTFSDACNAAIAPLNAKLAIGKHS